jgi:hypothetical protein
MKFSLEFDTDNAAFAEDLLGETRRILGEVAEKVRTGAREGTVWDDNGNRVGFWGFSRSPKEEERIDSLV